MDILFIARCVGLVALIAFAVWTIYQAIKTGGDESEERVTNARELLILALLWEAAPGEMTGLQLVERSEGELAAGTIYVRLGRLEDRGLVRSRLMNPSSARRLYTITERGRRAIRPFHVDREAAIAEDIQ